MKNNKTIKVKKSKSTILPLEMEDTFYKEGTQIWGNQYLRIELREHNGEYYFIRRQQNKRDFSKTFATEKERNDHFEKYVKRRYNKLDNGYITKRAIFEPAEPFIFPNKKIIPNLKVPDAITSLMEQRYKDYLKFLKSFREGETTIMDGVDLNTCRGLFVLFSFRKLLIPFHYMNKFLDTFNFTMKPFVRLSDTRRGLKYATPPNTAYTMDLALNQLRRITYEENPLEEFKSELLEELMDDTKTDEEKDGDKHDLFKCEYRIKTPYKTNSYTLVKTIQNENRNPKIDRDNEIVTKNLLNFIPKEDEDGRKYIKTIFYGDDWRDEENKKKIEDFINEKYKILQQDKQVFVLIQQ